MFTVKFACGASYEASAPLSVFDAAKEAGIISREVLTAKVNGILVDMTHVLDSDADVQLFTFADDEGKHVFWHTAAHILAQAVTRLYPNAKPTIGPALENGFYYDFDSEETFSPDALAKIESGFPQSEERDTIIEFIRGSKRGIIRGMGTDTKGNID